VDVTSQDITCHVGFELPVVRRSSRTSFSTVLWGRASTAQRAPRSRMRFPSSSRPRLVVPSIDQTSLTPSSHQQSSSAWPLKISILSPPSLTSNSPNLPAPLIKYNHECICSDLSSPDSFNKCHVKNLILSDIASQKSVECIADVYFIITTFFIG